ncbi:MAG: NAD(P)-dependent oxidoreductase [Lutisporaceae bacterium]|jgi:3-hydroxyisobutyrate dehydrogenase-like beta-hydroxyacid dehydrogenase
MNQIIGFFGFGAMGGPMAENLLKAGYKIYTVFKRSPCVAENLSKKYDLTMLGSRAEVAKKSDVIITCLPDDTIVKSVLMEEEFAAAMKPGTVIIEMSSTTSAAICEVERFYLPKGVKVIDAPVSGGVSGAVNGTLTIFGSGETEALDSVRPILETMGNKVYSLGSCGNGKDFKNLNNLLLAVHTAAAAEVFHIAKKQGINLALLYDVICDSSGMSKAFATRFKKMMENDLEGGFKLSLGRKDLANALALAKTTPTPLARLVYELMLANSEYDNQDIAVMCKLFEERRNS